MNIKDFNTQDIKDFVRKNKLLDNSVIDSNDFEEELLWLIVKGDDNKDWFDACVLDSFLYSALTIEYMEVFFKAVPEKEVLAIAYKYFIVYEENNKFLLLRKGCYFEMMEVAKKLVNDNEKAFMKIYQDALKKKVNADKKIEGTILIKGITKKQANEYLESLFLTETNSKTIEDKQAFNSFKDSFVFKNKILFKKVSIGCDIDIDIDTDIDYY